jgi:anaerobic ribonucleoside-triphosphate reductase activating protein
MMGEERQKGSIINMAAFLPVSLSNGPGRRAVVWVQGCDRNCPGCFNPDMQAFVDKRQVASGELAERILALEGIEGVTFSGGEPFIQAKALVELAESLKAHGLTVVVFTGYTFTELLSENNSDWQRLLAVTDLLVAGPYEQGLPARDYLRASANQQLLFLTDKLKQCPDITGCQTMEVIVDGDGKVITTGINKIF